MDKEHSQSCPLGPGWQRGLSGSVGCLDLAVTGFGVHRACTAPAFLGSSPWTSVLPTPARSSLVRAGAARQAEEGRVAGKCMLLSCAWAWGQKYLLRQTPGRA